MSGKSGCQVLEKVVEIAVQEIKALKGVDDLFAFAALAAVDCFDDHIGGDDVAVASDRAVDFVGADVEVFFSEESGESHLLVRGGGRPLSLNYGVYPYRLTSTQVDSLQIVSTSGCPCCVPRSPAAG